MDVSCKVLSDVILHMKYAKYLPEQERRETWEEVVDRNMHMHINKYPSLEDLIKESFQYVRERKILPSMRMMQFAGKPIELNAARGYNCSYCPIDSVDAFSEIMFLLLSGTGVGYSVQLHHIDKLPPLRGPIRATEDDGHNRRYLVNDSLEGWADAIKILMEAYFYAKKDIKFDFRDIRPKGALLVTSGGKAPGPEPLKECIIRLRKIMDGALEKRGKNCRLTSVEIHDLICHISDAVLSGGIRRSACISFFSYEDDAMMHCKDGEYWHDNPQRARANNSVVLVRHKLSKKVFDMVWDKIKNSNSGEPGIFLTNDKNMATNPCQPGWAKVLTPIGLREIKDVGITELIWTEEGWAKIINKINRGVKKVYAYETSVGVFYGTDDHKIVSDGEKIPVSKADSIDSLSGIYKEKYIIDKQDVMDGLVFGDGMVHKASNNKVVLLIGQKDQDYFTSEISSLITQHRPGIKKYAYDIVTTIEYPELPRTFLRKIPERFFTSPDKIVGFLRGLFSANGTALKERIVFKTTSKDVVEGVQLMLSSIGIRSYYTVNLPHLTKFSNGVYECRKSYDISITVDKQKFIATIGFLQKYKQTKLVPNRIKGKQKNTYKILKTTLLSEEPVYDITVDNTTHTYWTNGLNVSNCGEASLHPFTFCNLVTINVSNIESQLDFNNRCGAAAFIATLQAGFTDLHYLRQDWRKNTEKDALIGVSMTGIATKFFLENINLKEGVERILFVNEMTAQSIGINKAARTTLVKPDGTTALLLGTSSGIHAWYADYYVRRIRVNKSEAIYMYFKINNPELLEDDFFDPTTSIITLPIKSPESAITRYESAIDTLERVKKIYSEWILPGHRKGSNTHNSSVTVSIKEHEWDAVREWMWENRNYYNGITVLPYDGGVYTQAPFEEITKERFDELSQKIHEIDLTNVCELSDYTNRQGEGACIGGSCEIR